MFKIRASKLEFRTSLKFKLKVFGQTIKLFTFSGKRLLCFLLTMFSAAEKTLSEGTEVEEAHKCFFAMQENCQRSVNVCCR